MAWEEFYSDAAESYVNKKGSMMATVRRKKAKTASPSRKKTTSKPRSSFLPTEKNIPPENLNDFVVTIYGRKNIGKSSLAAQFEGSLTLMFEKGRKGLSIYQVPNADIPKLDWSVARDIRDELIESDPEDRPFSRLVLDTLDRAYDACMAYVCEQNGIKHPDNYASPWMIWKEIVNEFTEWIESLREAGIGITFVSHEKAKPLVTKAKGLARDGVETSTVKVERLEPSCSGQPWSVIQEICDYVFYYGFHTDGQRCITVRSPEDICWTACGMSDTTFLDPDGNPIEKFAVGKSSEEAYQTLLKAFNNEVYDVDHVELPTTTRRSKLGGLKKKKTRR